MSDWYKFSKEGSFFGQFYVKGDHSIEGFLSEKKLLNKERTAIEVNGLIDILNLRNKKKSKILDAPCGYGRHVKKLANLGYSVYGVDINPYFVDIVKKIPNIKDVKQCELNNLAYSDEKFNIVINMFYSFGFYENEADNIKTIKEFYRVLKKDGKLLLHTDVNMNRIKNKLYKFHEVRNLESGKKLYINEFYNKKNKRIDGEWRISDNKGSQNKHNYSMRVYTVEEYFEIFKIAGFKNIEVYSSFDSTNRNFNKGSEELIFVGVK